MKRLVHAFARLPGATILTCLSLFSLGLSLLRVAYTGRSMFLFMVWNLFLAAIPWGFASLALALKNRKPRVVAIIATLWLAFFPNSLYVLTDLIHLGREGLAPLWFDLILLLSYCLTSLLFGFISLRTMHRVIRHAVKRRKLAWLPYAVLYIAGFGVYLGRFLRWNSWDLLTNPVLVANDTLHRLIYPLDHQGSWAFTLVFGSFMALLYWAFSKSLPSYRLSTSK